jgi:uncharacterized protein (TIGR02611 family)
LLKRFFGQHANVRKGLVAVVGGSLILIGILMIFLPGPAVLVIPAGVAILATEFRWARALLRKAKDKLRRIKNNR